MTADADRTPGFRSGEVRRQMDVYASDGAYLGSVLLIRPGEHREHRPERRHFPERARFDGEATGPMPTQSLGNFGPITQSGSTDYATNSDHGEDLGGGSMLVGKYFGLLGMKWIPLDDIQTVAMERVILRKDSASYN